MKFENELKDFETEAEFNAKEAEEKTAKKMLAEVERYQALVAEKDILNEKWDQQNTLLVERHDRVVEELTEEFSAKLREEVRLRENMKRKLDLGTRESDTIITQMEEDMDLEILAIKEKYELRLAEERDIGLRLKGENGIMKKKFNQLQKDIHEGKEFILTLEGDKKQLRNSIQYLEKDITGLRKELWDRDDTIGDKERRIYDLKKKTQGLEKFKFVLDYKIKELKKQIEPRELDVAEMKKTIQKMDHELEKYHKSNAYLELAISDLKHKLVGVQKDAKVQREVVTRRNSTIKSFQADLHETSRLTMNPKQLVSSINQLYQKHVTTDSVTDKSMDENVEKEFARQRVFLEKTIETLKKKLSKDVNEHRSDNARILSENVQLLKEVNELRRELKHSKAREKALRLGVGSANGSTAVSEMGSSLRATPRATEDLSRTSSNVMPNQSSLDIDLSADVALELEQLRVQLSEAKLGIQIRDARVRDLEASALGGISGGSFSLHEKQLGRDPELEAAALKIQAKARQRLARAKVSKMREEKEEQKAATKIQAVHRGKAARKQVEVMRSEAEAEEPPPLDKEDSLGAM